MGSKQHFDHKRTMIDASSHFWGRLIFLGILCIFSPNFILLSKFGGEFSYNP